MNKMEKFNEVVVALKEIITDPFIKRCEYCRKRLKKDEGIVRVVLVYWARVERWKNFCNAKHADIYEKKVGEYWGTDKIGTCCE
ncbi:MAG: hypothetical protein Q7S74_04165 [Nanoarchaeota archaeon]|nr:hypothetical protein [Nanoarchaeota archaeon]